jgi:Domain of unknown function (DUF5348)
MIEGKLIYQPSTRRLVLQGRTLCSGDMLEVSIMGDWVSGTLAHDLSGWYILTVEQIGIRLREGIPARLVNASPISMTKKEL